MKPCSQERRSFRDDETNNLQLSTVYNVPRELTTVLD